METYEGTWRQTRGISYLDKGKQWAQIRKTKETDEDRKDK